MRINTNVSAMIANHHLNKTDNMLTKSMQRLSSGLKLNRAEDDSAGIAIAKRMHTQIEAISQTGRNGNDGVSVVQTAEGALTEIHAMLQRMRELAVQGANGTNSDEDREAIQEEVNNLKDEIVRVSEQTQFANITLLDGSLDRRSYCTVDGAVDSNNNAITHTSALGKVIFTTDSVPADIYEIKVEEKAKQAQLKLTVGDTAIATEVGSIKINNTAVNIEKGDTKSIIEAKIIDAATRVGATYTIETDENGDNVGFFTTDEYGSSAEIKLEFSDNSIKSLFTTNSMEVRGTDAKVDFATTTINGDVSRVGFLSTAKLSTDGNYVTVTDNGGFNMIMKVSEIGTYSFDVTDMGTMPIQIGIAEGQTLDIRIQAVNLETLNLLNTNFSTQDNCEKAIGNLDEAISYISSVRGCLGAYQNRLESAVRSIEVAEESTTSSLSRIEDTDMAEEMTNYTQMNVLTQAGISVLAQANERPQMVLQLLQ